LPRRQNSHTTRMPHATRIVACNTHQKNMNATVNAVEKATVNAEGKTTVIAITRTSREETMRKCML